MRPELARLKFEERRVPFACPRCRQESARSWAADWYFASFRHCSFCGARFRVRKAWLYSLVLCIIALLIPALLLGSVLLPFVREGSLSPVLILAVFASISLPIMLLIRAPLARRLLRFEYVASHAN